MGSDLGNYLMNGRASYLDLPVRDQVQSSNGTTFAPHTRLAAWKYCSQTCKHHGHVCAAFSHHFNGKGRGVNVKAIESETVKRHERLHTAEKVVAM